MFRVIDNKGFRELIYYGPPIRSRSLVYILSGTLVGSPTQTSIQVGPNQHLEDKWGQYINHSCNPTVKVVGTTLISTKKIDNGDSITFDYNESEDIVSHPFHCSCCGKLIQGKIKSNAWN